MSRNNPIRIRGIDHVVLRVSDLERSLHFYTEILDAREERRVSNLGLVQLRAGEQLIDLVPLDGRLGQSGGRGPEAEGRNVDHFALRLESFDETNGCGPTWRSTTSSPGEVHTRYGADGFGPSMYVTDPDGNVVELKGPPGPARLTAPRSSGTDVRSLHALHRERGARSEIRGRDRRALAQLQRGTDTVGCQCQLREGGAPWPGSCAGD